jgi:hypothetical protein
MNTVLTSHLKPHINPQERDFDLLLIEEFTFDSDFLHRFKKKIGVKISDAFSVSHSVYEQFGGDAWGETDILLKLLQGPTLLIENKLSAGFQDGQALRYKARAQHHTSNGIPALTILVAPSAYLVELSIQGPGEDWSHFVSYQDIADMMNAENSRSKWRRSLLIDAGIRSARVKRLSTSANAQKAAKAELLAFKVAWREMIMNTSTWQANAQFGAIDEFLYSPRYNPKNLKVWHHPMAGYLSIQVPKEYALEVSQNCPSPLPEGMKLEKHPSTVYLDAETPSIDMSAPFESERSTVEASMAIARSALDLVETALQ